MKNFTYLKCFYFIFQDVQKPETFHPVIEKIKSILGDAGLDVLINNAGVFRSESQSLENISKDLILEFLEVNTFGPLFVTQVNSTIHI